MNALYSIIATLEHSAPTMRADMFRALGPAVCVKEGLGWLDSHDRIETSNGEVLPLRIAISNSGRVYASVTEQRQDYADTTVGYAYTLDEALALLHEAFA